MADTISTSVVYVTEPSQLLVRLRGLYSSACAGAVAEANPTVEWTFDVSGSVATFRFDVVTDVGGGDRTIDRTEFRLLALGVAATLPPAYFDSLPSWRHGFAQVDQIGSPLNSLTDAQLVDIWVGLVVETKRAILDTYGVGERVAYDQIDDGTPDDDVMTHVIPERHSHLPSTMLSSETLLILNPTDGDGGGGGGGPDLGPLIVTHTAADTGGQTITATNVHSGTELWYCCDADTSNYFQFQDGLGYWQILFGGSRGVYQYTITGLIYGGTDYSPSEWSLFGIRDDDSLAELDEQTGMTAWGSEPGHARTFDISIPDEYKGVKFVFTGANAGSPTAFEGIQLQGTGG